ncbi:MAG: hypothetical protein KJO79_03975, partial [Verrucomicrobiae bacterium]|nr:hypothetical protein [Verrucomicrobiae bacterium]
SSSKVARSHPVQLNITTNRSNLPLRTRLLVVNLSTLRAKLASRGDHQPQIDGILGYDILHSNFQAIDFGNRTLVINAPE